MRFKEFLTDSKNDYSGDHRDAKGFTDNALIDIFNSKAERAIRETEWRHGSEGHVLQLLGLLHNVKAAEPEIKDNLIKYFLSWVKAIHTRDDSHLDPYSIMYLIQCLDAVRDDGFWFPELEIIRKSVEGKSK